MPEAPKLEWPTGEPLFEVHLRAFSEALIGNGIDKPEDMEVTSGPNNMEIVVGDGSVIYDSVDYKLNSAKVLTADSSDSTYTRYDTIYYSVSSQEPGIRTGQAKENATPPDIRNQEVLLAIVEIPVGSTDINDGYIQNWRTLVTGANFSGSHDNLTKISPDDHHARYSDAEARETINSDPDHGSTANHDYFTGDHSDLENVPEDAHHPKAHAHDGNDGSGLVDHSDIVNKSSDAHHQRYSDSEAVQAVNNDGNHGSSATHDYYTDSDVLAVINNDGDHGTTASHNYTTSVASINDLSVSEILTGPFTSIPSAGTANRWYFTTNENGIYYDDGSSWILIAAHPSQINANDLGFDPATQSELDTHANDSNAHHPQDHGNGDHTVAYLEQTTFSTHTGKPDVHHDKVHNNTDHSTNYTAQTTFNSHASNSKAHDPNQSDKYAEGGSYEMDAAEFAGSSGQAGQVLVTDGTSASWGTPTDSQSTGSDIVIDPSSTFVAVNSNSQSVTVTVPTTALSPGRELTFKDTSGNAGTNTVSIQTQGTETIEGQGFIELTADYASVTIKSTATSWYVTDYYGGGQF